MAGEEEDFSNENDQECSSQSNFRAHRKHSKILKHVFRVLMYDPNPVSLNLFFGNKKIPYREHYQ